MILPGPTFWQKEPVSKVTRVEKCRGRQQGEKAALALNFTEERCWCILCNSDRFQHPGGAVTRGGAGIAGD